MADFGQGECEQQSWKKKMCDVGENWPTHAKPSVDSRMSWCRIEEEGLW